MFDAVNFTTCTMNLTPFHIQLEMLKMMFNLYYLLISLWIIHIDNLQVYKYKVVLLL